MQINIFGNLIKPTIVASVAIAKANAGQNNVVVELPVKVECPTPVVEEKEIGRVSIEVGMTNHLARVRSWVPSFVKSGLLPPIKSQRQK